MPIDVDRVRGSELPPTDASWSEDDLILYHLGVGAGAPPTDRTQLTWTYERHLQALPTFGVLPAMGAMLQMLEADGMQVDLRTLLHGEQELIVHRPLPVAGRARTQARIADVLDKGKGALVIVETLTTDLASGDALCTNRFGAFFRGEGGFGGEAGTKPAQGVPDREPDHRLTYRTLPQQALLYRLCGDKNPLHADPAFAAKAGFEHPILHGLCTFGIACRVLVEALLDGDAAAVAGFRARFAGVLTPGETLEVTAWEEEDVVHAAARCVERDAPVLGNVVLRRA